MMNSIAIEEPISTEWKSLPSRTFSTPELRTTLFTSGSSSKMSSKRNRWSPPLLNTDRKGYSISWKPQLCKKQACVFLSFVASIITVSDIKGLALKFYIIKPPRCTVLPTQCERWLHAECSLFSSGSVLFRPRLPRLHWQHTKRNSSFFYQSFLSFTTVLHFSSFLASLMNTLNLFISPVTSFNFFHSQCLTFCTSLALAIQQLALILQLHVIYMTHSFYTEHHSTRILRQRSPFRFLLHLSNLSSSLSVKVLNTWSTTSFLFFQLHT